MIQNDKPVCDYCKKIMVASSTNSSGDELWPWKHALAHCCESCFDKLFDEVWNERDPCGECETQPCERGRECWFEPNLGLPYETYFNEIAVDSAKHKAAEAAMARNLLVHITLEDAKTLLYEPNETVLAVKWMSDDGEYIDGELDYKAIDLLEIPESGLYVMKKLGDEPEAYSRSKIICVKLIPNNLPKVSA
jgi:hypothetical protein